MVINSVKMVISYYPSVIILSISHNFGKIYKPMTIIKTFLIWFVLFIVLRVCGVFESIFGR